MKTTLRFYRSADPTIERSDTQLATRAMWMGTNRKYERLDEWVYVKGPSSSGTYYYGACVDEVAGESDTTNNCSAAVKVEFSHNKPDLYVGSWGVLGTRRVSTSLTLKKRVYNYGGPSEATTLRLIQLPNRRSKPSDGTQVAETAVPDLVVTTASPAFSLHDLTFTTPATPGEYHYVMCVDAVTGESDTTNNCSWVYKIEYR